MAVPIVEKVNEDIMMRRQFLQLTRGEPWITRARRSTVRDRLARNTGGSPHGDGLILMIAGVRVLTATPWNRQNSRISASLGLGGCVSRTKAVEPACCCQNFHWLCIIRLIQPIHFSVQLKRLAKVAKVKKTILGLWVIGIPIKLNTKGVVD